MKINPKGKSTFGVLIYSKFLLSVQSISWLWAQYKHTRNENFQFLFEQHNLHFHFVILVRRINRDPILSTYSACKLGIAFGSFVGCCSRWALSTWSGPSAGDRQCHQQRKATQKHYQNTTSSVEWNNKEERDWKCSFA